MLRKGIYVPMVTPFCSNNENFDEEAMYLNTIKLCQTGVAGLMPLGSNGEFHSLNDEEALHVVRTVIGATTKDMNVLVGASRESAYATIEWSKRCADEGADAIFVLTPSFFAKTTGEEGLLRYYLKIADDSPLPVLLYAAPQYAAGVVLPVTVVRELSQHPNCIGMKDSSTQPVEMYAPYASDAFQILAGSQSKFHTWMRNGAVGGVLSASNYVPDICVRLMCEYEGGKISETPDAMDTCLCRIGKEISGRFGVAGVKAAASKMGFCGGVARCPLPVLTNKELEIITQALEMLYEVKM